MINDILIRYSQSIDADFKTMLTNHDKKLRKSLDSRVRATSAALVTDLSKVSNFLPHVLLIAKSCTYGIKIECFNLLFCYLRHRELI